MAIDMDDEILQDFLVEAAEIIELLGEQLVELEQTPNDLDLLNAIFRGFHTVKGGAGFLAIEALVEVCHKAEDVFNVLRQGERQVTSELMDVVLQVVDVVNEMFNFVRTGQEPESASPDLLNSLQKFTLPNAVQVEENPDATEVAIANEQSDSNAAVVTESSKDAVEQEFEKMLGPAVEVSDNEETPAAENDEITEQEFDDLLNALHGAGGSPTPSKKKPVEKIPDSVSSSDEITEDEFENLLDEMHGKGKFSGKPKELLEDNPNLETQNSNTDDEITEDEFENLLDGIHGKGKFASKSISQQQNGVPNTVSQQPISEQKVVPQEVVVEKPFAPAAPTKKSQKTVAQGESTVRVDTQILDEIMNLVGELVLVRNRFQTLKALGDDESISKAVSNLDVVTADLQLSVMKTRMQPIKKVFGRFPRVVRDLARSLKKEIKLELVGEDTDLDKNLVEALADPLVHLVRNAVDHGIENPEERVKSGKSREGLVILTASQEGDHIQLTIEDNGKGMNADVIRKIAIEKGMMDEETASRLDDKECFNLIFAPGFSTKKEISDVSGRGVGMDVVKTRITQMNGMVEIDSKEGKGSTITIKVPLTLAIMPTLMVKLGEEQAFALPLASVLEILDLDLGTTNVVDGQLVIMVRDRALPLFYLREWLISHPNYESDKAKTGHVVVVNVGGRQVGFVVDQLIGQEEVVIKPLGAKLQGLVGLSGATIAGDGKIALILDVPGLMKRYAA